MNLRRLGPATIGALQAIARTPDPPPWVAEVEHFSLGGGAEPHLFNPLAAILAVELEAVTIGAVAHFPHGRWPGVQWLGAVLLDPSLRGAGHGHAVMRAAVDHAAAFSGRPYVAWAVHPGNEPGQAISRRIAGPNNPPFEDKATGYLVYANL